MLHILILFSFVYLLLPLWVCVIRFQGKEIAATIRSSGYRSNSVFTLVMANKEHLTFMVDELGIFLWLSYNIRFANRRRQAKPHLTKCGFPL